MRSPWRMLRRGLTPHLLLYLIILVAGHRATSTSEDRFASDAQLHPLHNNTLQAPSSVSGSKEKSVDSRLEIPNGGSGHISTTTTISSSSSFSVLNTPSRETTASVALPAVSDGAEDHHDIAGESSSSGSIIRGGARGDGAPTFEDDRNAYSGSADSVNPIASEEEEVTGNLPPVTRGDMHPIDTSQNLEYRGPEENGLTTPTSVSDGNRTARTSLAPPVMGASQTMYNTMSWLDAFMYQHRGSLWILFNTFFMVIWILIGGLSLYRLLGLPWCSLYLSGTQYLVIHLLIFTAATFEFVQLIHLSYGSHEGLPLFLTLLLTHTPTPCLAVSLIIMMYCIFVSARLPVVGRYSPPLIYVGILAAFIIVLSFVGDIIVGVSRNSAFLIVCRVSLTALCLACMFAYIFNYRRIVGVALLLRREFRGELKSLAIPLDSPEESQDAKLHLKKVLLTWSRITLVSCVSGVLMCLFSFCLSLFFTVSFVPLWAFWVLHSSIFVSQVAVVITLTFGAAFTLTYSNRRNIFYRYFFPSFPSSSSSDGSFIKRGNFIYQRVSVVNGPALSQIVPSTIVEREEQIPLRNNNIITELTSPPYRAKVNLKRSATFNCAPPYGFQSVGPPCSSNLYPVLSDHLLSYPNSQFNTDLGDVNDIADPYYKPLHVSNSFVYATTERSKYHPHNYARRYPMKSFHNPDQQFSSFSTISNNNTNTHRRSLAASPVSPSSGDSQGLAGTVETLEVRHPPSIGVAVPPPRIDDNRTSRNFLRQIPPYNHSFSTADQVRVIKSEPPEKPARRTEPILVKSVIRDNVNALPIRETADLDVKSIPPQNSGDPKICPENGPVNHSPPHFHPFPGNSSFSVNRNTGNPGNSRGIPSSYGSVSSPPVSHVAPTFPERNSPLYHSKFTPISSTGGRVRSPACFPTDGNREIRRPRMERTDDERPPIDLVPSISRDPSLAAESSREQTDSPSSLRVESSPVFPLSESRKVPDSSISEFDAPKRQSLKRNHSTAGDLTPSHKKSTDEGHISGANGQDGSVPLDSNGLKYPWYGTWGGRRRSKKRDSISEDLPSSSSGFNLRRLSASKSSLTSLYEKLKKPKKSGRIAVDRNQQQEEDAKDNEEDLLPEGEKIKEEQVTEEEEFLPRLDEDIDLASEIFKSSTVLADFYSLKRSDLKKRKKKREQEGRTNMEGDDNGDVGTDVDQTEGGNDSEYEDASSSPITNDNDQDSSTKSSKADSSDNT